jgi:hypothetical protein
MARKSDQDEGAARFEPAKKVAGAVAITLLCGGLFAGLVFGIAPLEKRAATFIDPQRVTIDIQWPKVESGDGSWMPLKVRDQLSTLAMEAAGSSLELLTADQLSRVHTAMSQSGWFAAAPMVTRKPGGIIRVEGSWRIPAANVRHKGDTYLLSWDGLPMPAGLEAPLWIYDPAVGPPTDRAGDRDFTTPWRGEDIAAALELLGKLAAQPYMGQIQGVDASQFAKDGSLIIITDQNTRIVWGGRPSKPNMGEISTQQKLAHLRQLVRDTKRIDANYPVLYINQERLQFDISATAAAMAPPHSESDE